MFSFPWPLLLPPVTVIVMALILWKRNAREEKDRARNKRLICWAVLMCVGQLVAGWAGHVGGLAMAVAFMACGLFSLGYGIACLLWPRHLAVLNERWAVRGGEVWRNSPGLVRATGVLMIIMAFAVLGGPIIWNVSHGRSWYYDYTAAARQPRPVLDEFE